jgi:hypothetical protein
VITLLPPKENVIQKEPGKFDKPGPRSDLRSLAKACCDP